MLFYEWLENVSDFDNFSPQQDLKEEILKDSYFPIKSNSYQTIFDFLNSRQEEDENYYNGYCMECPFEFVWEQFQNYTKKQKK